jgi:hypothetical protein
MGATTLKAEQCAFKEIQTLTTQTTEDSRRISKIDSPVRGAAAATRATVDRVALLLHLAPEVDLPHHLLKEKEFLF